MPKNEQNEALEVKVASSGLLLSEDREFPALAVIPSSFIENRDKVVQPEGSLLAQIGSYTQPAVNEKNGDKTKNNTRLYPAHLFPQDEKEVLNAPLYAGIQGYLQKHQNKVKEFQNNHSDFLKDNLYLARISSQNNPCYFRKLFTAYLQYAKLPECPDNLKGIRATSPNKANIQMEALLGKAGRELYQLALEEELNSTAYMDAIYQESTTHYRGQPWKRRVAVVVGGPSGSGKSTAANEAVKAADEFVEKDNDSKEQGNYVVAVDGGKGREASQIYKLARLAATQHGFTGIQDLDVQSKALETAKDRVRETVLQNDKVGIVIPETFTKFKKAFAFLNKLSSQPNTSVIFSEVDGLHDEDSKKDKILQDQFQEAVKEMGEKRAWETRWSSAPQAPLPTPKIDDNLQLNMVSDIRESKAYGASGFKPGKILSALAKGWYEFWHRPNLSTRITNDLILKKPTQDNQGRVTWENSKAGEVGALLVSQRIYDSWVSLPEPRVSLEAYNKEQKGKLPVLIQTSAELDLARAMGKITNKKTKTPGEQALLEQYQRFLTLNRTLRDDKNLAAVCINYQKTIEIMQTMIKGHEGQEPYKEIWNALLKLERETNLREQQINTKSFPPAQPMATEESCLKSFWEAYRIACSQAKSNLFSGNEIRPPMTLAEIIQKGEKDNNPMRQTFITLGWMNETGKITSEAPEVVKNVSAAMRNAPPQAAPT